jgi:hypothetical protein
MPAKSTTPITRLERLRLSCVGPTNPFTPAPLIAFQISFDTGNVHEQTAATRNDKFDKLTHFFICSALADGVCDAPTNQCFTQLIDREERHSAIFKVVAINSNDRRWPTFGIAGRRLAKERRRNSYHSHQTSSQREVDQAGGRVNVSHNYM